jgi:hypothetical protein
MKGKRGLSRWLIALFIFIGVVIIALLIVIIIIFKGGKNYEDYYHEKQITNPALGLSLEEAVDQFNEDFIYYILYSIKAYNLHDPPFSKDHPKIEFRVEEIIYSAEIIKGEMNIQEGDIEEEDILITTTREEAVKMIQDEEYVSESFSSGTTSLEMVAGDLELAAKGYLALYEEMTGEKFTGAAILGFK